MFAADKHGTQVRKGGDIPYLGHLLSVAGLVIAHAGAIPEAGQRFTFFGYIFEVMRRQRNQITALRIVPPEAVAASAVRKPEAPLAESA
jgi:CBS domain containing-hemolysin-like protein